MKLKEAITIPVEIGDTILVGKFKNKREIVKTITYDEFGLPVINGRKTCTFRTVPKVTADEPFIKDESKMKKIELQTMIRGEIKRLKEEKNYNLVAIKNNKVVGQFYTPDKNKIQLAAESLIDDNPGSIVSVMDPGGQVIKIIKSAGNHDDEKQQLVALLVKGGFNKNDAAKRVDANYDHVARTYPTASLKQKAKIITSLDR